MNVGRRVSICHMNRDSMCSGTLNFWTLDWNELDSSVTFYFAF